MTAWTGNGWTGDDNLERLSFFVEGVPVPQGSHSVFRGRIVDSNKGLTKWRQLVTKAAEEARAGRTFPADAEIYVLIDFYMPRGKTVTRRRPTTRPDADKCIRAVLDALTHSGIYKDDGQVVSIHANQWYADDKPGAQIVIGSLA
jgi:Holliday junction resolvase RusA-like endonuclease